MREAVFLWLLFRLLANALSNTGAEAQGEGGAGARGQARYGARQGAYMCI